MTYSKRFHILLAGLFVWGFTFARSENYISSRSITVPPYSKCDSVVSWPMSYSFLEDDIDQLIEIVDVSPELSLEGRKPLLLIHGWSFSGRPAPPGGGYWNNFKDYLLSDSLLSANFKPYYVKYWSNSVPVNEISAALRDEMEKQGLHQQKVAIVAHSMGGLVARSYMNEQRFTDGVLKDKLCGDQVDLLLTLGTPHHGSPMANGPARNAELSFFVNLMVSTLESAVFNDMQYDEVNRSDLLWDNYDGLFDLESYPNEVNDWLVEMNKSTQYDGRTICYSGSVDGEFIVPESGNTTQEYLLGAWFTEEGFGLINDGIVPVKSAEFDGHTVKLTRHFDNYNHADIIRGTDDKNELFDPLKNDLMDAVPLRLLEPGNELGLFVDHSQVFDIEWVAPVTVMNVNLFYSIDNGNTYISIASGVDASLESYSWLVPDVNSSNCKIRIVNADFANEADASSYTFTIYHNRLIVTSPSDSVCFVGSRSDTIRWKQQGIGDSVKIVYIDSVHGIERVVVESTATSPGMNSYVWNADETLPSTGEGILQFFLTDSQGEELDSMSSVFYSSSFQMFSDSDFEFLSPYSNPVDFFGVSGEQLEIGISYGIGWKAMGEVKYFEFYLCDENKNKIELIGDSMNVPKVEVEGVTEWVVSEHYGDEYYFLARVGFSPDSILFERYSSTSFRINESVRIVSDLSGDDVGVLPCFDAEVSRAASSYIFWIGDSLLDEKEDLWIYESTDGHLCVPDVVENELRPGKLYRLMVVAQFDSLQSFTDNRLFYTKESLPGDFEIVSPLMGDSLLDNDILIQWNRSLGAAYYTLELQQEGSVVYAVDSISRFDTSMVATVDDRFEDVVIEVTAINSFGEENSTVALIAKDEASSVEVINADVNRINFLNYPNPFSNSTTIEFVLTDEKNECSLAVYNLSGKELETIASGDYAAGKYRILWSPGQNLRASGVLVCRLSVNGQKFYQLLMME